MGPTADNKKERQPYDPLPFRLTRAGKYPDIEEAIEGVLSVAASMAGAGDIQ